MVLGRLITCIVNSVATAMSRGVLPFLVFAFSEALGASLERWHVPIPSQLLGTLPYVLTIVALVGFVGRAQAPAALGTSFEKA